MARIGSVALAGFFPFPEELLPALGALFVRAKPAASGPYGANYNTSREVFADPCAGKSEALIALLSALAPKVADPYQIGPDQIFTCEMEANRFAGGRFAVEKYAKTCGRKLSACFGYGDALRLTTEESTGDKGITLLYLNPPYDHDKETGRLEEKFLRKFLPAVVVRGWCAFVVPHYALAASAETLGCWADSVQCVRLPDPQFGQFSQVVLLAKRGYARHRPDPEIVQKIQDWARDVSGCPILGTPQAVGLATLPGLSASMYRDSWTVRPVDPEKIMAGFKVWHKRSTLKEGFVPIEGYLPPADPAAEMGRKYPVAVPPKPAHVATAIAAGVFNGCVVEPDSAESTFPRLLVKGVFDREWQKVEDKHNAKGDKIAEVQVQVPELSVTVLDLERAEFFSIKPSLTSEANVSKIEDFTMADLLAHYGQGLMGALQDACPAQYDPGDVGQHFPLPALRRKLFTAQVHVARAATMILGGPARPGALAGTMEKNRRKGKCAWVMGEVGSGKSTISLATAALIGAASAVVVCPPHLLTSWTDQAAAVLPAATVTVLDSMAAVDEFNARVQRLDRVAMAKIGPGPWEIGVLSRETAKLGHTWASLDFCPKCGERPAGGRDAAEFRLRCKAKHKTPTDARARDAVALAAALAPYHQSPTIREVCPSAGMRKTTLPMTEKTEQSIRARFGIRAGDSPIAELEIRVKAGAWEESKECGEPLFQAKGKSLESGSIGAYFARQEAGQCGVTLPPKGKDRGGIYRYPLASYIAKWYPNLADCLILDEVQDYANGDSAQSHAIARLQQLGWPAMRLTGTVMNGYASSLFEGLWVSNPKFRAKYERGDLSRFVKNFGYSKRVVDIKDVGKPSRRGAMSDLKEGGRIVGQAPGVLPTLVLQVLENAVTLHKSELDQTLPPCTEEAIAIEPSKKQSGDCSRMLWALVDKIAEDRFGPLQGLLFGAMNEIPSALDRLTADVGNRQGGGFEVRYPASAGGALVTETEGYDASEILPKEQWMIDRVKAEIAEGRNVLIFTWHTELMPRYQRLLSSVVNRPVVVLDSERVPAAKRETWINENVVAKRAAVLIVNPMAVQTGLNNLVYFATEIFMENPAVHPHIYRQAVGRVDRIGQKLATRILFPYYKGTLQQDMHRLLLKKVAVAMNSDGLDPKNALSSAGIGGTDTSLGMSLGRQLFELAASNANPTLGEAPDQAPPAPVAAPAPAPVAVAPVALAAPQAAPAAAPAPQAPPVAPAAPAAPRRDAAIVFAHVGDTPRPVVVVPPAAPPAVEAPVAPPAVEAPPAPQTRPRRKGRSFPEAQWCPIGNFVELNAARQASASPVAPLAAPAVPPAPVAALAAPPAPVAALAAPAAPPAPVAALAPQVAPAAAQAAAHAAPVAPRPQAAPAAPRPQVAPAAPRPQAQVSNLHPVLTWQPPRPARPPVAPRAPRPAAPLHPALLALVVPPVPPAAPHPALLDKRGSSALRRAPSQQATLAAPDAANLYQMALKF